MTVDELDLTTDVPDFMGDITNDLGNLGTHSDGFDVVFDQLATDLSNAGDVGSVLDDDLGALDTSVPGINPTSLDSDHASLPGTIAEGNAVLSDANDLVGSITPTPPPPTGGGGGGGGGGGTTPSNCATLDMGTHPFLGTSQTAVAQRTLTLRNVGPTPMRIISWVFVPNPVPVFGINPEINGKTVPVGGSIPVNIVFVSQQPGKFTARLTVKTSQPDPQPCVDVIAAASRSVSSGGGLMPCNASSRWDCPPA